MKKYTLLTAAFLISGMAHAAEEAEFPSFKAERPIPLVKRISPSSSPAITPIVKPISRSSSLDGSPLSLERDKPPKAVFHSSAVPRAHEDDQKRAHDNASTAAKESDDILRDQISELTTAITILGNLATNKSGKQLSAKEIAKIAAKKEYVVAAATTFLNSMSSLAADDQKGELPPLTGNPAKLFSGSFARELDNIPSENLSRVRETEMAKLEQERFGRALTEPEQEKIAQQMEISLFGRILTQEERAQAQREALNDFFS